jgi:NADH-quinone oxidoreductase subunit B
VVLLQQRIRNEDMQAKWRGDEFQTMQAKKWTEVGGDTGESTHGISTDPQPTAPWASEGSPDPIVVGGGPIE